MADAIDQRGLAFPPFDDEPAALVAADRPHVVGEHAEVDPVEVEPFKGVLEDEVHRFPAQADPELGGVVKADREASPRVALVQPV